MAHILILGGGFGGVAAARRLREELPAGHKVTLIDRRGYYMIGFRKTWGLLGEGTLEEGQRRLSELEKFGIEVVQGNIEAIDPAALQVKVDGRMIQADAIIVALGAELAVDAVPGFTEFALNAYDPAAVKDNAEKIRSFEGGRVLVGVFGLPYKCPPAPYELAILLQQQLRARGVPLEMTVFTPMQSSLPILNEEDCGAMDGYMLMRGIRFLPGFAASRVEAGTVYFHNGESLAYDLLLGIPQHRAPKVVRESGLTDGGPWVPVDARTLESAFPNVYAIGDVTSLMMENGRPLPKAGVFAEGAGLVVAHRLAAQLSGRTTTEVFEGHGACFLEIGDGKAVLVQGHFLAPGGPQTSLTPASEKYIEEKWAFEQERLTGWFD